MVLKWQTLRLRIQKHEKSQKVGKEGFEQSSSTFVNSRVRSKKTSRPEKCSEILKIMARNAIGVHKEKIEHYAYYDQKTGIQLLEAIYNKLLTDKDRPASCPSRYINSSPVIAQRILKEALYR